MAVSQRLCLMSVLLVLTSATGLSKADSPDVDEEVTVEVSNLNIYKFIIGYLTQFSLDTNKMISHSTRGLYFHILDK